MTIEGSGRRIYPLSVWTETDVLNEKEVKALVMILDGPGCGWWKKVGCTMCGYCNDTKDGIVSTDDLLHQVEHSMKKWDSHDYIKIFTSGSFLDPEEIPIEVQKKIMDLIGQYHPDPRVLVESRPEFIQMEMLEDLSSRIGSLEVAIGLETSSDRIRRDLIHKGFTLEQFQNAGKKVINSGSHLKTYLLMKPPLLGESDSIEDMVSSVKDIHGCFPGSTISINPMNIQSNTPVEGLHKRGLYRTPWLWSLLEVLKRSYKVTGGITHLMSSPTGGGKKRGSHNCGKCDENVLSAIREFSLFNEPSCLPEPMICCRNEWTTYRDDSNLDPVMARR